MTGVKGSGPCSRPATTCWTNATTDEDDASLHELRARAGPEPELADCGDRATDFLEQARGRRADHATRESTGGDSSSSSASATMPCSRTPSSTGPDAPGDVHMIRESARAALGSSPSRAGAETVGRWALYPPR